MTAAQLRTTMRVLVLAVVVVVPLAFWRGVDDSFDLTKATALGVLGAVVLTTLVLYLALGERATVPVEVQALSVAMTVALVVATVTSMSPITSLIGQTFRYTGLFTLVCCLALYVAASTSFGREQIERFTWVCTLVALAVVGYALLQVTGNDPFSWESAGFSNYTMSTLSNPNISAGFIAIVLPLVAYTMLRSDAPRWAAAVGGAVFGGAVACLSVFDAFQGPVAALTTVAVLVAWAAWSRATLGGWIVALVLAATVVAVPVVAPSGTLVIGAALGVAGLMIVRPRLVQLRAPSAWRAQRTPLAVAAGGIGALLVVLGWRRVIDHIHYGLQTGLRERGDLYRTAWTIFREHPVLGSGLETYGILFPAAQPASHAINLESWLSSSAHSVPLGMFSNGGVVLGLTYLTFVAVTGWTLIRCIRATPQAERGLIGAIGAAWLAFQIQSLVSFENVVLFSMHFILSGLIMALAAQRGVLRARAAAPAAGDDVTSHPEVPMTVGHHGGALVASGVLLTEPDTMVADVAQPDHGEVAPRRISVAAVAGAAAVCCLVATVAVPRPLRAAHASHNGSTAMIDRGDLATALAEFRRAVDLAPWQAMDRLRLAEVSRLAGDRARALDELAIAADDARGNPDIFERAANIAFAAGDDTAGLAYFERAVEALPAGPTMRARAAAAYVTAGGRAAEDGDVELARARYGRALQLIPGLAAAEDALAAL